MFQVAKLSHLKILNLCGNHISVMEGLKELKLLTWLSIANNHIKAIEQLNQVLILQIFHEPAYLGPQTGISGPALQHNHGAKKIAYLK